MAETIILDTQSFQLELSPETFAPVAMKVQNEELAEYYEDDSEGLTMALIRELAINLQAAKEINAQDQKEILKYVEENDALFVENNKLRSDNEMLRDAVDVQQ